MRNRAGDDARTAADVIFSVGSTHVPYVPRRASIYYIFFNASTIPTLETPPLSCKYDPFGNESNAEKIAHSQKTQNPRNETTSHAAELVALALEQGLDLLRAQLLDAQRLAQRRDLLVLARGDGAHLVLDLRQIAMGPYVCARACTDGEGVKIGTMIRQ
jgi:hypothetical protein